MVAKIFGSIYKHEENIQMLPATHSQHFRSVYFDNCDYSGTELKYIIYERLYSFDSNIEFGLVFLRFTNLFCKIITILLIYLTI